MTRLHDGSLTERLYFDWRQEMATLLAVLQEVAEEVRGLKHGRGGTQCSLVREGVPVWLLEAVDEAAVMLKEM